MCFPSPFPRLLVNTIVRQSSISSTPCAKPVRAFHKCLFSRLPLSDCSVVLSPPQPAGSIAFPSRFRQLPLIASRPGVIPFALYLHLWRETAYVTLGHPAALGSLVLHLAPGFLLGPINLTPGPYAQLRKRFTSPATMKGATRGLVQGSSSFVVRPQTTRRGHF